MSATREELIEFLEEAESRGDMAAANAALDKIEALGPSMPEAKALPDEVQPQELPERPETAMDAVRYWQDKIAKGLNVAGDVAGTALTGMVAEVPAGLAAIGTQNILNPNPTWRERANNAETVRGALTMQPRTPEGQQVLQSVAEFIEPGTEMWKALERHLGDTAYDVTESPVFAGIVESLPFAVLEMLGLGLGKGAGTALARQPVKSMDRQITKSLDEAAPTKDALKSQSTQHFRELDAMNVTVNGDVYAGLVDSIEQKLVKGGMDKRVTPEVANVLEAMRETQASGKPITLSEIEVLREIANNAVDPLNKNKARLGMMVINDIDDFLEGVKPEQLNLPPGKLPGEIGVKYRQARDQWGRYRRAELLDKAVSKAEVQASGLENGLRIQFRQILNNERKSKFFTDAELAAMRQVEQGTGGANLFKALGKAGIDFGGKNNALLAMLAGGGAWAASGNPILGLSIVAGSSIAKKLAERLTARNAAFANQVVRAGSDARKITEVYIRNTPKAQRSAEELSLILMNKNIDLKPLNRYRMEAEASKLAMQNRAELAAILAVPQVTE
jgi:hypothetical protein